MVLRERESKTIKEWKGERNAGGKGGINCKNQLSNFLQMWSNHQVNSFEGLLDFFSLIFFFNSIQLY